MGEALRDRWQKRQKEISFMKAIIKKIKELFLYRNMIGGLVKRDLRGRYKGSILGFLWNFVNPLCQMIVYTIVFSTVFPNDIEKYYVFIMVGMMPWNFFSDSLMQGSGTIVHQAEMTKKIYFPREVLPMSTVISRLINLLLTFLIMLVVIIVSGVGVSFSSLIWLPLVLLIEFVMALGFSLLLSAIDVYFRDVEYMTGVVLMAWIWMTPIMYSFDAIFTPWMKWIVGKNPMTPIILAYQNILYYHTAPDMTALMHAAIFALIIFAVGEFVFCKLEGDFAEQL